MRRGRRSGTAPTPYSYGNESVRLVKAHAVEFQSSTSTQPMYMYLAWNVVHGPNEAPPNYAASNAEIRNTNRRYLAAMVESVDDAIATLVETLKEVRMWENTVLAVTTDNGGPADGGGTTRFAAASTPSGREVCTASASSPAVFYPTR